MRAYFATIFTAAAATLIAVSAVWVSKDIVMSLIDAQRSDVPPYGVIFLIGLGNLIVITLSLITISDVMTDGANEDDEIDV